MLSLSPTRGPGEGPQGQRVSAACGGGLAGQRGPEQPPRGPQAGHPPGLWVQCAHMTFKKIELPFKHCEIPHKNQDF